MPIIVNPETGEVITGLIIISDEREMVTPKVSDEVRGMLGRTINVRLNAPRGAMREITCQANGCNERKMVRVADIKRGWGKFCSRSCSKK